MRQFALVLLMLLSVVPAWAHPGGNKPPTVCAKCGDQPPLPALGAMFVSQSVPTEMTAGQAYPVTVTMTNIGSKTWSDTNNIRLGSQNPQDNTTWGLGRVAVGTAVATEESYTFSFQATAPAAAGTYNFQWRMVQDGVAWFGDASANVAVTVKPAATNTPPTVSLTSPTAGSQFQAPASLMLAATAADTNGSIASVNFRANGVLLGTDTTAPYGLTTSGMAAGTYQLIAEAIDNQGAKTSSSPVAVSVASTSTIQVSATRTYVYDAYGRTCKTVNPESGATIVDYDAAGNVAWSAEGLNLPSSTSCDREQVTAAQKVLRSYDARNRLVAVATPGGSADLLQSYYADGSVKSMTVQNPGSHPVTTTYTYNHRGLLTGESSANGSTLFGLVYGYDPNGNLATLTYPDSHVVSFAPDALGRATRVAGSDGAVYAQDIKYNPQGAIAEFVYGNGIKHLREGNLRQLPARSLDSYWNGSTEVKVLDDRYGFDANGNVTDITDAAQNGLTTRGMGYDGLDRLVTAASPQQWGNASFAYDPLDNLRSADQGARQYRYNYDASNRLASIKSPVGATLITLGYDTHGNTTSKNGRAFVFDAVNRMNEVTGLQAYRYDGQGRRVQTTDADGKTTFWIYSQSGQVIYTSEARRSQNLAYIYLGNTQVATRAVAWGSGTATVRYQHTDSLGSPVAETDALRNIVKRNSFTPYGETFGSTVIDGTGYTGHVMDRGTGLTYMQQRYYDPQIYRLLSADPAEVRRDNGANFNRYYYGSNSPYVFTDPDGRNALSATDWIDFGRDVGSLAVNDIVFLAAKINGNESVAAMAAEAAEGGIAAAALSTVGVVSPAPGTGRALKVASAVEKAGEKIRPMVGKLPKPPRGPGSVPKSERDPKRFWTRAEQEAQRKEQGHQCGTGCGTEISEGNDVGHHIERHADGGATDSTNQSQVCRVCHDKLHGSD